MNNPSVHAALERFARTRDFSTLTRFLADDVELRTTMAAVAPTISECKGRGTVLDCLQGGSRASRARAERAEITGDANRFVVVDAVDVAIPFAGAATHDAFAVVFEMRDGAITRIVIHHELGSTQLASRKRASGRGRDAHQDQRTHQWTSRAP